MTPERTCRTCAHCRPRDYVACGSAFDCCDLWGSTTMHAVGFNNRCGRQRRSWFPAPWHRRVFARIVTALERVGWLR